MDAGPLLPKPAGGLARAKGPIRPMGGFGSLFASTINDCLPDRRNAPGPQPPAPEIGRNANCDAAGAEDVGGKVEGRHTVDDDSKTEADAEQGPDKQKSKFTDAR